MAQTLWYGPVPGRRSRRLRHNQAQPSRPIGCMPQQPPAAARSARKRFALGLWRGRTGLKGAAYAARHAAAYAAHCDGSHSAAVRADGVVNFDYTVQVSVRPHCRMHCASCGAPCVLRLVCAMYSRAMDRRCTLCSVGSAASAHTTVSRLYRKARPGAMPSRGWSSARGPRCNSPRCTVS